MESLPEKSPFPVHSFTSPCPSVRSVNSAPTPPLSSSSSCRSVSIFNPFDDNLEERLRHSVYSPAFGADGPITICSTCVFGHGHNTDHGCHSKSRRQSIDTISILNPTDIDMRAARRQERAKLNSELEAQTQNSLSEFFRSKIYEYYSPSSCSRSDLDEVSNYEEEVAVGGRDDNTIESDMYCEQGTQTILTVPTHLDLMKLIGHLHSYQEEQTFNRGDDNDEIYSPTSDNFPMDRFSSSSPLRSCGRNSDNQMRRTNHETKLNWCSHLDIEDELLSLNDDEDCDNEAQNKSRSSSLGEDVREELSVSPIPFTCSNSPLGATPARGCPSNNSQLLGAKLTCSSSPKSRLQQFPTSPIPHSSSQLDDPADEVFEAANPQLTSSNTNGVRFLSVASEEEEGNFSEAASEHHRIQQGSGPESEENYDAAAVSLGAIDEAAVSFAGRLESTRQMSIEEDVAMLSSIRNDTLMVTAEDSGFIGSGGNRDQRFAPALSSTRIGAQFLGGLAADSGCSNTGMSQVTNLMNSQDAVGNNSQDSQDQRIGSGRSNTHNNYREPIAEVASFNNTQNSFMFDEESRDMFNRSAVNNESSAPLEEPLDTTSAGIRDQFQDFGLISPMGATRSLSESLKLQKNYSLRNSMTPLPEPRTKLPRTDGTPDLTSFHVETPQNKLFEKKSFKRELFTDEVVHASSINDSTSESKKVISNSTASCSGADRINRAAKTKLNFGELNSNENSSERKSISHSSTNITSIPLADRTNQNMNDSPHNYEALFAIGDATKLSGPEKSSSTFRPGKTKYAKKAARRSIQKGGSLSDVLQDQWWHSRTNKQA